MPEFLPAIVRALYRHPIVFWLPVLCALAAAGAASVLVDPVWRAKAVIAVAASPIDPVGLLENRQIHRQALARLGSATPSRGDESDIDDFDQKLNVHRRAADAIEITLDGKDGALAARRLDSLLQVFADQRAQLSTRAKNGALDEQLRNDQAAFDAARERLESYRRANKLGESSDERQQLERQHTDLDAELNRTAGTQADLATRVAGLKSQLEQTPATTEPNDPPDRYKVVDDARARLLELQLKERELLAKYTETSQFVLTVRDEISRVQAFLDEMAASIDRRNKRVPNDAYVGLSKSLLQAQTQMTATQQHRVSLENQLMAVDRRLDELKSHDGELQTLEKAKADSENELRRTEAARQTPAPDPRQGITVVERPAAPSQPRRPWPALYFSLALPFGLLAGLGLATLAERFSDTFATPGDVERRLGVPVLTSLPYKP